MPVHDKKEISRILPGWRFQAVSKNENSEDLNVAQRLGNFGGIATLWKEWLAPYTDDSAKEGNERFLVTKINLPSHPLCIVNCYLSSGTSKVAINTFREDLDRIQNLAESLNPKYDLLVMGDLNMDIYNRRGPKEQAAASFINNLALEDLGKDMDKIMTYENPHLEHYSHIDHAMIRKSHPGTEWGKKEVVLKDQHLNSSYHHPISVYAVLPAERATHRKAKIKKKAMAIRKYDRGNIDSAIFQETLDEELRDLDVSILDAPTAVSVLQRAVDTAMATSTPYKIIHIGSANKRKKDAWTPEFEEAVRLSKLAHHHWKMEGRPRNENPTWLAKKSAKRKIRRVQRQQCAADRQQLIEEINKASEDDDRLFHKLIKRRREGGQTNTTIMIDDAPISEDSIVRDSWASYYEDLATPKLEDQQGKYDTKLIRLILEFQRADLQVDRTSLDVAIKQLSAGKAPDSKGHYGEQIKLFTERAKDLLFHAVEQICSARKMPNGMKEAYKLPIPKNGKDPRLMDNYRGITISSIFTKILENIIANKELRYLTDSSSNNLQVGFTRERSPVMASLLITEAIADAKTSRTPLHVATLDARKAFDVVNHDLLMRKLYLLGLGEGCWSLIDNMYADSREAIRWKGEDSRTFRSLQGVKQGSVISPMLYKTYINDLLDCLQRNNLGTHIGHIYIGAPTCADDVLLISNSQQELQSMLSTCYSYSQAHYYELHPKKSSVTTILRPSRGKESNIQPDTTAWHLGEATVSVEDRFTHLGLVWSQNARTPDIQENISRARRTAFALISIGMHGKDGLGPATSFKIVQTYVVPRLLHGIQAAVLSQSEIQKLETFYRKILRQLQNLPENTASSAIYMLIGALPIEATYHIRCLTLYGSICRLPKNHQLYRLALRQTSIGNKLSWFKMIEAIGDKYEVNIYKQLHYPWDKLSWKKLVKEAVRSKHFSELLQEASQKKTLKWLISPQEAPKATHDIWTSCSRKPHLLEAAINRARLLVGRFRTQEALTTYHPEKYKATCLLCETENEKQDEDVLHMTVTCKRGYWGSSDAAHQVRKLYIEAGQPPPRNAPEYCSALLNGSGYMRNDGHRITLPDGERLGANQVCTNLCNRLIRHRDLILNELSLQATGGAPT